MKTGFPRHLMMTFTRCQFGCCQAFIWYIEKSYVLSLGDGGEVDLDLSHGENIGRGAHVDQEVCARTISPALLFPFRAYIVVTYPGW